jgi:uncharacterized OsmC-like protein
MSEERSDHVTIRLAREYEFVADFNDVPDSQPMLFDEPEPLGHGRAPNAAAVLGSAVGDCLAASFAFCLRKARIPLEDLEATVTTHVARNEKGRYRISGIDVELTPECGDADPSRIARCEELFEDFCVVTQSVRQGIPVNVTVRQPAAAGA